MLPRNGRAVDRVGVVVAQQAADHEALARAELDRRLGAARGQRRDVEAVEADAALGRTARKLPGGRASRCGRPRARSARRRGRRHIAYIRSVTVPSDCEIGIGNSPPARKLAVSPDRATRIGSASVVTRPVVSPRFSVAEDVHAEQAAGGAERGRAGGIVERSTPVTVCRHDAGDRIGRPVGDVERAGIAAADAEQEAAAYCRGSAGWCRSRGPASG